MSATVRSARPTKYQPTPRGSALPQGRPITEAEWKRRQRAGATAPDARRRRFEHHVVWTEPPRNGLPWKPYVYRGAG